MTLTLVGDPGSGNIDTYPSGLVVLRAEDYIGPARGTLTTAADSNSLSGTVVVETQDLVVPTTLSGVGTGAAGFRRWPLASDTLRIPVATISPYLSSFTGFYAMLGMKVEGESLVGAQYQEKWGHLRANLTATSGVAWGRDSTFTNNVQLWTSVFGDQYRITDRQSFNWSQMSGITNLVCRIWGVTGGTMSFSADMVYLMPWGTLRLEHLGGSYMPFAIAANGVVGIDEDDNISNVLASQISVTQGLVVSEPFFSPTPMDIQDANDEPTVYDISDGTWNGSFGNPLDPKSWLSFIAAPHYIPAQTIIDDDFTDGPYARSVFGVVNPDGYIKSWDQGSFFGAGYGGTGPNGWYQDATQMICQLPNSQPSPATTASFQYGINNQLTGASATDPTQFYKTLWGLEDLIMESDFSADTTNELYHFLMFKTVVKDNYVPTGFPNDSFGVLITLIGGALEASLIHFEGAFVSTGYPDNVHVLDGPFTLDGSYSPGDKYQIKLERRRNTARAKVWADGSGEPGAWDLEGFLSIRFRNTANTVKGFVDHPYDTNWAGDTDHDVTGLLPWNNSISLPFMMSGPGASQPDMQVFVDNFKVSCDPDGTTPVDMFVQEENYDGTSASNTLTIPYSTLPSWRFVEGSLRKRHFSTDTRGFNLRGWKDTGSPELQLSGLPIAWELGVLGAFLPQIYRLVIF